MNRQGIESMLKNVWTRLSAMETAGDIGPGMAAVIYPIIIDRLFDKKNVKF